MIEFLDPINVKVKKLLNRLTEARAANLDNCNSPISDCAQTDDPRFNHLDLHVSKSLAVLKVEEFSSSASFTVPSNVYLILVEMLIGGGGGGGGGSGGGTTSSGTRLGSGGAGGGGAEAIIKYPIPVNPGDTVHVVIGAGGNGGSGGDPYANGSGGNYGGMSYAQVNGVTIVGALGGAPGGGGPYNSGYASGGQPRYYSDVEFNAPGKAGGRGSDGEATSGYNASGGGSMLYPYLGGTAGSPHTSRAGGGGGASLRGRGGNGGDGASDSDGKAADPGQAGQGPGAGGGGGGAGTKSNTTAYRYGKAGGSGHDGYALLSFLGANDG